MNDNLPTTILNNNNNNNGELYFKCDNLFLIKYCLSLFVNVVYVYFM